MWVLPFFFLFLFLALALALALPIEQNHSLSPIPFKLESYLPYRQEDKERLADMVRIQSFSSVSLLLLESYNLSTPRSRPRPRLRVLVLSSFC
jgi:hypothetical protein